MIMFLSIQPCLLVLLLPFGHIESSPIAKPYASNFGYTFDPVSSSFSAPAVTASQFHAQDEFGQFNYGYSNPLGSKVESKTADGVVRGAYSYIDANGQLQTVQYISDVLGFRASGTNIPVGPEAPVAQGPSEIQSIGYTQQTVQAVPIQDLLNERQSQAAASVMTPSVAYSYLPYATNYAYEAHPSIQEQLPRTPDQTVIVSAAAPYVTQSRFHAQDEFGRYHFGYSDPNSARSEIKSVDGTVTGVYNYVDDSGKVQTVHYSAGKDGFQAVGTNIPQSPQVVVDTPEVAAAKLEHARLVNEIRARDEEGLRIDEANAQFRQSAAEPSLPAQPILVEEQSVLAPLPEVVATPIEVPSNIAPAAPVPVALVANVVVPVEGSSDPIIDELVASSVSSQFHAQDEQGQYSYGYANKDSSKVEQKTADGVVRGAYKYIDAHGELQSVEYISDAFGFRVAGTNIPVSADGEINPAQVAVPKTLSQGTSIITPQISYSYLPYAVNYEYLLPSGASSLGDAYVADEVADPVVIPSAPQPQIAQSVSSQYHAQDEAGGYNYGYSNGQSSKQEAKGPDGVVRGAYSYIDANGKLQTVQYISDALGFRAAGTNFPQADGESPMIGAKVKYSYLPYAVNHAYYF